MKKLPVAVREFTTYLKVEKNYSENTIRNYSHCLNEMLSFFHARDFPLTFSSFKPKNLSLFRKAKVDTGISASTSYLYVASLRSFAKWALARGYTKLSPVLIELPKVRRKTIKFLPANTVRYLIDSIDKLRDRAIVELMFATGLRVSEVVALNRSQMGKEFEIVGKGGYSRLIFLSNQAQIIVKKYLDSRTDKNIAFFVSRGGKRISVRVIQRFLARYARQAGISVRVSPHMIRHSFATFLMDSGADLRSIQEFLGHRSIATTQIYTHVSNKKLRQIYDKCQKDGRKSSA